MLFALDSTFMPVELGQPYLRDAQEVARTAVKMIAET
jgi:hypothetical protein